MKILAIDPGYERLGIAVVEKLARQKETLLYSACVRTEKTLPHAKRLLKLAGEVKKVIDEFEPEAFAIETLFFATNHKTVMPVAEARGAVLVEAARAGLKVFEYTPLQIKIAVTGYGRSEKHQVTEMVKRLITIPEKQPSSGSEAGVLPLKHPSSDKNRSASYRSCTPFASEDGRSRSCEAQIIRFSPLIRGDRENKTSRLDDEYDAIAVGLTCLATVKPIS